MAGHNGCSPAYPQSETMRIGLSTVPVRGGGIAVRIRPWPAAEHEAPPADRRVRCVTRNITLGGGSPDNGTGAHKRLYRIRYGYSVFIWKTDRLRTGRLCKRYERGCRNAASNRLSLSAHGESSIMVVV
jgi:hypothetical protein